MTTLISNVDIGEDKEGPRITTLFFKPG